MAFPAYCKYIIIGAGIHGLSTAFHLSKELKERRQGSGKDILVIVSHKLGEKTGNSPVDTREIIFPVMIL